MSATSAVIAQLLATSTITTLVGQRINAVRMVKGNSPPAVVVTQKGDDSNQDTPLLLESTVEISVIAANLAAAETVIDLIDGKLKTTNSLAGGYRILHWNKSSVEELVDAETEYPFIRMIGNIQYYRSTT